MPFELDAEHIAAENRKQLAALEDDYDHLGRQLARRGIDIDGLTERAQAFRVSVPSWGVGTGGTRFARFPGPGEPRNVFEKLEDCEVVFKLDPLHARHLAAHPLGQAGRAPPSCGRSRRRAGLHRLDELEHLPGSGRPAALVQVRQPEPHRRRGAPPGHRAQPRMPGAGREARRPLAHRVDRRRRQLPRTGSLPPGARSLPRQPARRSTRRCPTAGGSSSSTSSTSPRSTPPCSTTGARATTARASSASAPARSSISGHHAPNVNIEMIVARLIQFGKLGGLPLQRQQVRRRRPRRRIDQAVPAVPDLQRAGRRRARAACRASTPPTCSTSRTT